jgi:hypothetical protein
MTLSEIIAQFRVDSYDRKSPYLWTDEEATDYANDAYVEAARRAHFLVDSSSSLTQIPVVALDPIITIDERVIFLRRARLTLQSLPLKIYPTRVMDEVMPGWDASTNNSTPTVLIPDWESDKMRLYPTPILNDTLLLTAVREPLEPLVADSDVPEGPPRYHRKFVHWMLYRAYSRPDEETQDLKRADKQLAYFEAEFGEKVSARSERFSLEQYYDIGDFA